MAVAILRWIFGKKAAETRSRTKCPRQPVHCALQEKLAASLVEPEPLYTATCG